VSLFNENVEIISHMLTFKNSERILNLQNL